MDIVVSAPTAPIVQTPFAGGTSDSTPFISWTGGSGQFELVVTNLGTGEEVINELSLTTTSFTPTNQLEPGFYRAIVTAVNLSGRESSVPYDFEVIRIAVNNPAQGSLVFDTTPEFTFTAIPDAEVYQIWVSELDPETGQGLGVPINQQNISAATALVPGTDLATFEPQNPLPEGFYRVWVRAFDAQGNAGDWSRGNAFTITRPIITGPAFQTGSTIDSTPTITWTDIDADNYQIWLTQISGTTADGTVLTGPQLIINEVVQGTSFTPAETELGNGQFRVWVRAIGNDGEAGLWSEQYNFTRDLTAGPQLISPIAGINQTDRTPVFVWEAQEGATHYEIWVNSSNGITRIIHDTNVPHIQGASEITFTDESVLLFNATYRWWVRAFNEDGAMTDWSTSETFFVPVPTITQPAPVAAGSPLTVITGTNLPTFSWTGVPEYVSYELWVNNLTTGQSQVIFEQGIEDTTFTPSLPIENGTFRFWVRGVDIDGNISQWSNPVTFEVDSTVGNAPILVSPQTLVANNTPTFEWIPVAANVSSYEILVKNLLVTGQPTVLNDVVIPVPVGLGNLEHTPATIFTSGTYRWWVRGLNDDGTPGPWAQPLDFQIASAEVPAPQTEDSLSVEQPMMLTSLQTEVTFTDEVKDITVHPAGVVATVIEAPAAPTADIPVAETAENAAEVDSVMEELATADWWRINVASENEDELQLQSDVVVVDERTANRSVTDDESDADKLRTAASALGLAFASTAARRTAAKRDDE